MEHKFVDKHQKTMYICNGKACKDPIYCKVKHPNNWLCAHTTKGRFAKNGPCMDPWNHEERFTKEVEGKETYFVEKLED